MRIVVNTRLLLPGKLDGIGWFIHETMPRIASSHPEVHFVFLFDRQPHHSLVFPENVSLRVLAPPTRHPLLWYTWFEWMIPHVLKKENATLFLSPDGFLSLQTNILQLPVIHDINFIHRPQDLPLLTGSYYRHYFPKFAKKAARIATVSRFTSQDLHETLSVPPDKIDVVFNGVNTVFSPPAPGESVEFRKTYTSEADYFIYVGSMHPRKNILGLLKAFENFKNNNKNPHKLVIVGERMFKTSQQEGFLRAMNHQKDVVFIRRLEPQELKIAIGSAKALLLVSFFEGFGLPILEAMKCDTPVICSNLSSMPEVALDAAILVNPESTDAISDAMHCIDQDSVMRSHLIEKGRRRSLQFSWDQTAELLWQSIEKTLFRC
jgi:glycosyltransferase involved in cell wall biosynthesis